jgi:hypothetical protein
MKKSSRIFFLLLVRKFMLNIYEFFLRVLKHTNPKYKSKFEIIVIEKTKQNAVA